MIIPVKKATIICLKSDKDKVLKSLQLSGEMMLISQDEPHEAISGAGDADEILSRMRKYSGKKGLFTPRREVDAAEIVENTEEHSDLADEIKTVSDGIAAADAENARLGTAISRVSAWNGLDTPAEEVTSTRHASVFTGYVPPYSLQQLEAAIEQSGAQMQSFGTSDSGVAVVAVCHKSEADEVRSALLAAGFVQAELPVKNGLVADEENKLETELSDSEAHARELTERMETLSKRTDDIELLSDRRRVAAARSNAPVEKTRNAVVIKGWVRQDRVDDIKKTVSGVTDVYDIDFADPEPDELAPTATQNNKFVEPFTAITNMFSPPSRFELDPNPVMAPMYWIIFGMMMADVGYGLMMLVLISLFLKFMKPRGLGGQIAKLLLYSSIPSIIFGVLFGSYFGDTWHPLLFSPMDSPLSMLILSLVFGVIHIFSGMFIAFARKIRDGQVWDAIFDEVSWMVLILGLGMLFLPATAAVGKVMAIVGALTIICTAGRSKPNIFGKITGGFVGLYGITGYMSDILSYSRILALCLSTSVVGMVMNMLAHMIQGSVVGFIASLLVYIVGHVFNLAMGLLSGFVHDSRLQYIEFFGKFYEGGGVLFAPFSLETKYIDVRPFVGQRRK